MHILAVNLAFLHAGWRRIQCDNLADQAAKLTTSTARSRDIYKVCPSGA